MCATRARTHTHTRRKTIPDSVAVRRFVEGEGVKRAVVIGGGFIGIEMVENLVHRWGVLNLESAGFEAAAHAVQFRSIHITELHSTQY